MHSILDGRNLSDHNPLAFSLNLPAIVVDCPRTVYKPTSISWSKAASKEIYQYQSIVAQSLVGLGRMLSDDIVLCCNPSCTSHQTRLDEISNQLVTCLKSAADYNSYSVQLRLAQFFLGESVQVAPASTCASAFI